MPKILFISFRWNDHLQMHSSDKMMGLAFKRKGWDVHYYDYRVRKKEGSNINSEIVDTIKFIEPDIIFVNKGESVNPNIIKQSGFKGITIFWNMDQRRNYPISIINWSKVCDWVFECSGGSRLKQYHDATGTPTSFLFSPYEEDFVNPFNYVINIKDRQFNLTFYGQLYKESQGFDPIRRDIIPKVRNILDDYGACFDRTFIRGIEYYGRLSASKMSISIPAIDLPYYFSNRQSHIMGSRSVVVSYDYRNCSDMFTDGENIIIFKTAEELMEKVSYALNNIDTLEVISENSYGFAKEYMKSDRVVDEIIYTLKHGESSYPFKDMIVNPRKKKFKCLV